jgi:hypothetical protein
LLIVSIDELIEKDLFVNEVMLTTKKKINQHKSMVFNNFTFKNGNANGRNGKFVAACNFP